MAKTCVELIKQFNELSTFLPTALHNKITEGKEPLTPEECGVHFKEALLAFATWREIEKRVTEYVDYSAMLQ